MRGVKVEDGERGDRREKRRAEEEEEGKLSV